MDPINQLDMDSVRNIIASLDPKFNRKTSSFVEACYLYSDNNSIHSPHYLPPLSQKHLNKKTLVLDLDETLVHSTFDPIDEYDYKIPLEIDGSPYEIYVLIRPGVTEFLREMSKSYELVIYTASLEIVINININIDKLISFKLYREHCVFLENFYIKDLSLLGRDLKNVVIIDNCAESFSLNTYNGITIKSWYGNKEDTELSKLIPFLKYLSRVEDVRKDIMKYVGEDTLIYEKLLKDATKGNKKENKKNHKSISFITLSNNLEYSDPRAKKDEKDNSSRLLFKNSVSNNMSKSNKKRVNDLKNFSTMVLKRKENIYNKINSPEKYSFCGVTTNSPVLKSQLEQTNTTVNYSNLETTINKLSSNSSNNGNKNQSCTKKNGVSFSYKHTGQPNKSWKIFTEVSTYLNKANNEKKCLRNSANKKDKLEGGKSVILNKMPTRSRNNNIQYMNTSYFNIEDKSINYYTQYSDSKNCDTPTQIKGLNTMDLKLNFQENSFKKGGISQNYFYSSLRGKKESSLKETKKLIYTQNIKDLNLNLTLKKKHNVSFSEKNKSPKKGQEIRSYCKELLRKNEAQFTTLFNKPKCKKKVMTSLKSTLNSKKKH